MLYHVFAHTRTIQTIHFCVYMMSWLKTIKTHDFYFWTFLVVQIMIDDVDLHLYTALLILELRQIDILL